MAESREFIFPPQRRKYIEMGPVRLNTVAGTFIRNIPTINFTQGPLVTLNFEELMGAIVSIEDDLTFPPLIRVVLPAGSTTPGRVSLSDSFQCTVINLSSRELEFELADPAHDHIKLKDYHGECRALPNTATVINAVVSLVDPIVTVCYLITTYATKDYVKEMSLCSLSGITAFVTEIPEHPTILDIYVAEENFGTWRKWCLYRWERSETWSECTPTPGMLKYVVGGTTFAEQFVFFDGVNWRLPSAGVIGVTHAGLPDAGTLTHAQLDSYLDQGVKTTDQPTFDQVSLTGTIVQGGQATTKAYVDSLVAGLVPTASVKGIFDNTGGLPVAPLDGDRYIAYVTANGWSANMIYERNGAVWVETVPSVGMVVFVEGGSYFSGLSIMYTTSSVWTRFGITMDHADLRNRGVLAHTQIDGFLNQSVKSTATPTFAQTHLSSEPSVSTQAMRYSQMLKHKTFSFAGSLRNVPSNTARLNVVADTEMSLFYFRKDVDSGLGFSFKMPRDWADGSSVFVYIQYATETARDGQVFWKIWMMNQHETDDTDRILRWDSFERFEIYSKVLPRELTTNRAISTEIRVEAKPGEVFTGMIRRMATDGSDTVSDGVFLQDIGVFYYSNRFGDDSSPSF